MEISINWIGRISGELMGNQNKYKYNIKNNVKCIGMISYKKYQFEYVRWRITKNTVAQY